MQNELSIEDFGLFVKALRFAAEKHRDQRRKGKDRAPYINHPIAVAETLWQVGGVRDINVLVAALLHDTIEDTGTTQDELRQEFGEDVLSLVMECTDDKSLPKLMRKDLQIQNAPHKTTRARQIKLADKINNVAEIAQNPPRLWSKARRREYLDWTEKVINGLRGQNAELEAEYDRVLAEGRARLL